MGEALETLTEKRGHSSGEVRRLSPYEWSAHWPNISDSLDRIRIFWEDYWTKEFINEAVMNGVWQAWGFGKEAEILNMIVLTQIVEFPAGRVLQVLLAWGNNLDRLLPTIEAAMEKFAIMSECRICEVAGRVGWEKKLPRFKRHAVLLKCRVPKMGVH